MRLHCHDNRTTAADKIVEAMSASKVVHLACNFAEKGDGYSFQFANAEVAVEDVGALRHDLVVLTGQRMAGAQTRIDGVVKCLLDAGTKNVVVLQGSDEVGVGAAMLMIMYFYRHGFCPAHSHCIAVRDLCYSTYGGLYTSIENLPELDEDDREILTHTISADSEMRSCGKEFRIGASKHATFKLLSSILRVRGAKVCTCNRK